METMRKNLSFIIYHLLFSVALLFFACGGSDDGGGSATGGSEFLNVSNVDIAGGNTTATMSIQASQNCDWVISWSDSWIRSITPTKGRGSQNVTLTLTVNPSSTGSRTAVVTVKTVSGSIIRDITVTQSPNSEQLDISPSDSIKFTADGGSQEVNITSNTHWTITGMASWTQLNKTSGEGNGIVTITLGQNTNTAELRTTLTFSGDAIKKELKIIQAGREISLPVISNLQVQEMGKDYAKVSFSYASMVPVIEYGVCYSTSPNPTIEDNRVSQAGSATNGDVTFTITGLSAETKYYVRAYARIQALNDPGYSDVRDFTTSANEPNPNDNKTPEPIN